MKAIQTKVLGFSFLVLAHIVMWSSAASAALTPDQQARLLAGFAPLNPTVETAAITNSGEWQSGDRFANHWRREESFSNGTSNLFGPSNAEVIGNFFAQNLGRSREETKNLIYFFGGPDVLFPNLLFPHLEKMVLVGLENPGSLLDPANLKATGQLGRKMAEISRAYVSIMKMSYYITNQMSSELSNFGTTTMICVGLVANDFVIQTVDHISIDGNGNAIVNPAGNGVRIAYKKPNGQKGEVYYFRQDLSDGAMQSSPGFLSFMQQIRFDTAYYKAASYVPQRSDFSIVDNFVLNSVNHVVQNDDGLPFRAFRSQAASWDIRLFGVYTRPDKQFGAGAQADLVEAYGSQICQNNGSREQVLFQGLWGSCNRTNNFGFASLSWQGTLPFHYGYAGMSGPGTYGGNPLPGALAGMTWNEMVKWSNLLVADKR